MSFDTNGEVAVNVSNLSKIYKIFDSPWKRFIYHMFHNNSGRDFVALENISFEVKKGESFGIIGRNGSGKSTLLQILAGIIGHTSGEINVNGKVAALLELGSGFNPESTGYENIYMNAAILGVKKDQIDAKVDEIIEFADIGDFIYQPVKTYSSGMYIRLAFAVAINVDADILLIDEALAVGDVFFRQKCYSKLNDLKKQGKTIILVSHGLNEIEQFCDRAMLLNKSKMIMVGPSREVVQKYYAIDILENNKHDENANTGLSVDYSLSEAQFETNNVRVFGDWEQKDFIYNCNVTESKSSSKAKFINIGIFDKYGKTRNVFHQGEEAFFLYEVEVSQPINVPLCGIVFFDHRNTIVFGKDNLQTYTEVPAGVDGNRRLIMLFKIKMNIAVGEYTFDAGFNTISKEDYDQRGEYNQELLNEKIDRLLCVVSAGTFAIHERNEGMPTKIMFHGCADLPTEILLNVDKHKG